MRSRYFGFGPDVGAAWLYERKCTLSLVILNWKTNKTFGLGPKGSGEAGLLRYTVLGPSTCFAGFCLLFLDLEKLVINLV